MNERRDILRGLAGLTATTLLPAHAHAQASRARVRVTLVRWPYT